MPTKRKVVPLPFEGGWSTALSPEAEKITHLLQAQNCYYTLDGGIRKIPGAVRLNSTQLTESGAAITVNGLFDYWKSGTTGSPTQRRMAYAGTQLWSEAGTGVWTSRKTGLEANKRPCSLIYNDLFIWSSSSLVDVPQKWNQTDAGTSNLGGSPPNFAFCVAHRGRLWGAGVATNPSRLYYSALDNPEDWTGAGSGSIDIDISDGDEITGLASHKQRLWIFKGPSTGSIHYLTGSAPTGGDAFARVPFSRSVGCVSHASIVSYLNDLAWVSLRGIHSLTATDAYGDMAEGFLVWPIQEIFQDELNLSALQNVVGVNHSIRSVLLWSMRLQGQTTNGQVWALDYRFQPPRWTRLTAYSAASLAVMLHNSKPTLYSGGYDGYTLRHDQSNRNIADAAYTATVTSPFLSYGQHDTLKQTAWLRLALVPHDTNTITVRSRNGEEAVVVQTVQQAGFVTFDGTTLLDGNETFGGAGVLHRYLAIPGSFASQQFEISQGGLNQDLELRALAVQLESSGMSEV